MYGGTRSGSVCRWDIREASNSNILIPPSSGFGSITHVSTIREWQLLVSTIFGDLKTYDLRFMRPVRPLMHFAGHNNQYIVKLGITVDPCQDFVFAGGQDCRIRAWSLRSGESLQLPPISSAALENNPFLRTFSDPVVAMHITESDKGICLWAASGGTLHRYHLGQHSGGSS
ncbi:hypothetical protein A0H81_11188 [Grifola frondosa]|uniref:Uncharacterized protein n=1 Tax=Grifola frondosa TaxID=5627 RepID=A0A1C7LVT1_GRIFR|nr:hypothetical protein A0H81_11188 [Grifola frondosa]